MNKDRTAPSYRDAARYWTTPLLAGGELLTATFRKQRFCRHWHDTYVIPMIQGGAQGYWYRGCQQTAPAGSIAAINPGEIHTGERVTPVGWAYRAFYPTVEWMQGLSTTVFGAALPPPWFPDATIMDVEVAKRLLAAHVLLDRDHDRLEAETALYGAFALLVTRHAGIRREPARVADDDGRVAAMQERLRGALTESVSLTDLAESVGLSPFHAARLFTRAVGMPPHAWRIQVRIAEARRCLRSGLSVADAATTVGFFDQSHFTRHFKRVYGTPPGSLYGRSRA